jgi:hypothetical protein
MPFAHLLDSLLNFIAPALFLAPVLALAGRWVLRRDPAAPGFWLQSAINAAAGVAVLAIGLAYFGRDGRMASYVALVLVCASVQWACARGWRR